MGEKRDPYAASTIRSHLSSSSAAPKLLWCFPEVADCLGSFHYSRTFVGCAFVAKLLSHGRKIDIGLTERFSPPAWVLADQLEKSEAESRGYIYVTNRRLRPSLPFEPSLRL